MAFSRRGAAKKAFVSCDWPGCMTSTNPIEGTTAREVRASARAAGWTHVVRFDVCPIHPVADHVPTVTSVGPDEAVASCTCGWSDRDVLPRGTRGRARMRWLHHLPGDDA